MWRVKIFALNFSEKYKAPDQGPPLAAAEMASARPQMRQGPNQTE